MKKTRRQKVMVMLVTLFLCASFFAFPVTASADSDYASVTFNMPNLTEDTNLEFFRFTQYVDHLNSKSWNSLHRPDYYFLIGTDQNYPYGLGYEWTWPSGYGNAGVVSFYIGRSKFNTTSYNTSDTIWVDPVDITFHFPFEYTATSYFRISLRAVDGKNDSLNDVGACVGRSKWIEFNQSNIITDSAFVYSLPSTQIYMLEGGTYEGLAVCIDVQCNSMNSKMGLGFYNNSFVVNYGQGTSPNFPAYTPPSGSSDIGQLDSMENQAISSASSGLSQSASFFSNVSNYLGFLGTGLSVATNIMYKFVNLPSLGPLVTFSLSLGLVASLLGLAGAIISASDRRASSAARAANNSAWSKYRSLQSKYYNAKISFYRSRSKK